MNYIFVAIVLLSGGQSHTVTYLTKTLEYCQKVEQSYYEYSQNEADYYTIRQTFCAEIK